MSDGEKSADPPPPAAMAILEEMLVTQEKIFEKLAESSKLIETDGKVFEEMRARVSHYSDLLRRISSDMVEVCERVDSLKRRLQALEAKK